MKTILSSFLVLLTLHPAALYAEEDGALLCRRNDNPLDVLSSQTFFIESMASNVKKAACDGDAILAGSADREKNPDHTKAFCEQMNLCVKEINETSKKDAAEMLSRYLSKAALLSILDKEISAKSAFNIRLKYYEESTKSKLCPEVTVDAQCEKDIREAYMDVAGTKIVKTSPLPSENIQNYISKNFFILDAKHKRGGVPDKDSLKAKCDDKLNLAKICKMKEERLSAISKCELKVDAHDCINDEQAMLAKLVNKHQTQMPLFYALQQQLCLSSRVVTVDDNKTNFLAAFNHSSSTMSLLSTTIGGSTAANIFSLTSSSAISHPLGLQFGRAPSSAIEGSPDFVGPPTPPDRDRPARTGTTPDDSAVIRDNSALSLDVGRAPATETKTPAGGEEIKSFLDADKTTLSDSFSNSLKDSIATRTTTNTIASTNSEWNTEFANRFNSITEEEKRKKDEDKKRADADKAAADDAAVVADKKKKDDTSAALLAQINSLKGKLDEMTQKVDDLKNKKSSGEANPTDNKEAVAGQKAILDLKAQIAALEADRRAREAQEQIDAQKARAKVEAQPSRSIASVSPVVARNENAPVNNARDNDNKQNNYVPSSNNYVERSTDVSVHTASVSSGSMSGIVLKVAGTQATPDSTVVYMTANEMQKYPFHLSDSAGNAEIESMLQKSNGSSIIVGESEQIIPIIENGTIAVDESGKIKYKRVKISLVKNDKERKQSIAREISSLGDLKKDEDSQRALIRYQEMKKALKLKDQN